MRVSIVAAWQLLRGAASAWRRLRLADILIDGQDWELVAEGFAFTEGPAVDARQSVLHRRLSRQNLSPE